MNDQLAQLLTSYQPAATTIELIASTPILLLVGPTGAGKDSLKDRLLATHQYHHIVSHTTRPPRINHGVLEQDGQEYHFIDHNEALEMLQAQAFVEAKVYSGNLYGTSVAEIQAAHNEGKIAVTDIEVQGVAEYKKLDDNVMAIFLLPPDFRTWQDRLQRRYGDVVDAADMKLRLQTALDELDELLTNNYYFAIVNNDLAVTVNVVETITRQHNYDSSLATAAKQTAQQLSQSIADYLREL